MENVAQFDMLSQYDVVAWNAMLFVYFEQGNGLNSLYTYMRLC